MVFRQSVTRQASTPLHNPFFPFAQTATLLQNDPSPCARLGKSGFGKRKRQWKHFDRVLVHLTQMQTFS